MECLEKAVISAIREIEEAKKAARVEPACCTEKELFNALRGTVEEMIMDGRLSKVDTLNNYRLHVNG